MAKYKFNYESKIWGGGEVNTSPFCLTAPKLIFALKALEKLSSNSRVLEVGCGAGGISKAVKRYRKDLIVTAVDISKLQISIAKKNKQGVIFKLGSAYKLPFKDKSFDAVLMFDVLEHLAKPQKALDEIKRVLKKDGLFSLFTPIEGGLFTLHGLATKFLNFTPKEKYGGHIQNFRYKDVLKLLSASGLLYKCHSYYGHLINQIFDFGYFTLLFIRKKNVYGSLESMIAQKNSLGITILRIIKNIVSLLSYLESKILFLLPASGVSILSISDGNNQKSPKKS